MHKINAAITIASLAGLSLAGCAQPETSSLPLGPQTMDVRSDASAIQAIYSFKGKPDGQEPNGDLIVQAGALYGTTLVGGADYLGTIFKLTPAGDEKQLFTFAPSDASNSPNSGLIFRSGTFYGTTDYASYAFDSSGKLTLLHKLAGGSDGDDEQGPLLYDNGSFYGLAGLGGLKNCNSGCGLVYAVSPAGKEHVVYDFKGKADGFAPAGALVLAGGTLYGTTSYGGKDDAGTIYRVTPGGAEKIVYNFTGNDDGSHPTGKLLVSNGTIYASTQYGGHGFGSVVAVKAGKATVLHEFSDAADGGQPNGSLRLINGTLYGTTIEGGSADKGVVFSLTLSGQEKVLGSFAGSNGDQPQAGLVLLNGYLYGTTVKGGAHGDGTVFKVKP